MSLHAGLVSHSVVCHVGVPSCVAGNVWRPLSWQPASRAGDVRQTDRLLPRFTGDIGMIASSDSTLVLAGSYEPPGAAFGAAADRAGLERVAFATGRRLLSDIGRRLSETASGVELQNGSLPLRR